MAREKKKEEKGATRFWLLAALVGVVMAAKALRLVVKRDEEYYDR